MAYLRQPTVTRLYWERSRSTPDLPGFRYRAGSGSSSEWRIVPYREHAELCRLTSYGLMGLGVQPRDRVALISNTRLEWAICDMAVLGAAAVTVPIYASNTADDCAYILGHSEATVAFAEDGRQLEKILSKRSELPGLRKIVVFEPSAMQLAQGRDDVITLQALRELGRRQEAKDPTRFERQLTGASPEDLITICYTSGTTGVPKGVMLTHGNLVSGIDDILSALSRWITPDREVMISFLPFSHIIGKVQGMTAYAAGWQEAYAGSIDTLVRDMAEIRPTILVGVPRVFEKAHARILAAANEAPASKRALSWGVEAGRRVLDARNAGRTPSLRDTAEYALASRLVFSKIRARFGGRLRFALSGGAPLSKEIGEFFQIAGIPVVEGYGLTETTAGITATAPDRLRYGTVGKPLTDVQLRIADDGEILVRSAKVFKGYYKMPKETAEAFESGWFLTGDIGEIDADGVLRITDRKKDLIITSGGKNVAPQKIENLAKSVKYLNQLVVHGDRRNYLTALMTLDREAVMQFAAQNQILYSQYSELIRNPKIQAIAQRAMDELNQHLASFETIKKFVILPEDFSIEGGELTPSMKVKRGFVSRKYQAELDSMYTT